MNAVCYSDIVVPVYKIILRYFPRQNSLITWKRFFSLDLYNDVLQNI
jgi:hypothetical protein